MNQGAVPAGGHGPGNGRRALWEAIAVSSGALIVVGVGILGLSVSATRAWPLAGVAPAGLLMILMGFSYYRMRLRSLEDAASAIANAEAAERAAARLAEQQQRLSDVIEGINVGTWEWDLLEGSLHVNDRYGTMLGRSRDDLTPFGVDAWRSLVHPEDLGGIEAAIDECLRRPQAVLVHECRMQHADGRWIWILSRGKVIERAADGRPLRMGGIHLDVSVEKVAELALIDSESKFRSLFELSPVGIALNDWETGRFLQMNAALLQPTGYSAEELLQKTSRDITPVRYAATDVAQFETLERTGRYGPYEKEYLRKDGGTYPVLLSGIRMLDSAGRAVVWSIVQDISHRKSLERALAESALRDKLTGLPNRALFMESLQNAVTRVQTGQQARFAVLCIDFDQFKLVNDTLGHKAGDELLRQIAKRLLGALRTGDAGKNPNGNVVSRFGGDEFLILINDLKAPGDACVLAERLLNVLSAAYDVCGNEVQSTASIGIVTSEKSHAAAEDVVRNADVAMYEAKRSGRACSVVFDEAMHTRITRHVTVETALRRALGSSELYLLYQPIVELSTGRMVSVEALIRWNHPELGEISPSEFIPIAEESGLIVAVGRWVLKEACRAFLAWRVADPARAPNTVSVNVSRAELALGERLLEHVKRTLDAVGLEPKCLQLEVTEREVMRNPEAALGLMQELRRLGVKLAMDDFGTGTSSLGFLRDYPFDTIKIDRAFANDLTVSPEVLAVNHATINLIENLGMASLAEGVEEFAQVAVLQSLGCRYAQGFFFSRPVRAEHVLDAVNSSGISLVTRTDG
jgi:diguanylate cyclase (GGDEF)-like protein/PAS domain S-box-containing protein